jgi:hypothetical protein
MPLIGMETVKQCSRCEVRDARAGQAWCQTCHAAYCRANRKPLTEDQRRRDRARSYAGVYLRKGKLQRKPCEKCGDMFSQMHHEDYSKPLEVVWLCRPCHLRHHQEAA